MSTAASLGAAVVARRTRRVLICCDDFKGTLSALAAAEAVGTGVAAFLNGHLGADVNVDCRVLPLSDGGLGFLRSLVAVDPSVVPLSLLPPSHDTLPPVVLGPLGTPLPAPATFALSIQRRRLFIESATAIGLPLVPPERRNPMLTTTFGLGTLIRSAWQQSNAMLSAMSGHHHGACGHHPRPEEENGENVTAAVEEIVLGLGGSATSDCGIGALQALGFAIIAGGRRFGTATTATGDGTTPPDNASSVIRGADVCQGVESIEGLSTDTESNLRRALYGGSAGPGSAPLPKLTLVCDVTNPLVGPEGAAAVYGPQKGATPADVIRLDEGAKSVAQALNAACHVDVSHLPRAGAAGGVSGTFAAAFGARLLPGAQVFAEWCGLSEAVRGADLVITGEGRYDQQTRSYAKTVSLVCQMCAQHGKPVVVVCGSTDGRTGSRPDVTENRVSAFKLEGKIVPSAAFVVAPLTAALASTAPDPAPAVRLLPAHFALHEAMSEPAVCIARTIERALEACPELLSA